MRAMKGHRLTEANDNEFIKRESLCDKFGFNYAGDNTSMQTENEAPKSCWKHQ